MNRNGQLDKDHYHATLYEGMKRSMELPAGCKPPIRRDQDESERFPLTFLGIVIGLCALVGWGYLLHALWLRISR